MTQYEILDSQFMRAIEQTANKALVEAKILCAKENNKAPLSALIQIVQKIQAKDQQQKRLV